jgi:hypothetical protein
LAAGIACTLLVGLIASLGIFSRTPRTREEALAVGELTSPQTPPSAFECSYALEALAEQHRNALNAAPAPEPQTGPLQLRGHVFDNFGKPLAGATVTIAELGADKPGVVRCLSAADGSFEAHGEWRTEQLVLRVVHEECWNAVHKSVSRGLEGLEVRLERFASLDGMLAMSNREPLPDLQLTLTNQDTKVRTTMPLDFASNPRSIMKYDTGQITCSLGGAFTLHSLRPGRYDLEVAGRGIAGRLARVNDIAISAGERWNGRECNPLLLEARVLTPVQVKVDLGDVPDLARGSSLRVYFKSELELWPGRSAYPSALLDEKGRAVVALPEAGRYELIWYLESIDPATQEPYVRPVTPSQVQYAEVPASHEPAELHLELDANQRKELARRP